jgi:sucrose-phosphate synthase
VFIEAAAHGLPFIGTNNGGPVEINAVLSSGVLVDAASSASIADGLISLITDRERLADATEVNEYLTVSLACT